MEKNQFFPEIKGRFGFGFMRLPLTDDSDLKSIDQQKTVEMVDAFLDAGFNYFDTARPYHSEASETMLKKCLTSRYPRDRFILANKLSDNFFKKEEDLQGLFDQQLEACGVDYFDFLLMHAVDRINYEKKYRPCNVFSFMKKLKAEGKAHHIGFSFHDTPEFLEQVINDCPETEFVQLQFNYFDYDNPAVQSRACYDVCKRHGIPVIVMEGVKGGTLVKLPEKGEAALNALSPRGTNVSYALRFAADFENVMMVLSGMSDIDQMQDNVKTMNPPQPLSAAEKAALGKVKDSILALGPVGCTGCHYCVTKRHCPKNIPIPEILNLYNQTKMFKNGGTAWYYPSVVFGRGQASECIGCAGCESVCPQNLPIRLLLGEAHESLKIYLE